MFSKIKKIELFYTFLVFKIIDILVKFVKPVFSGDKRIVLIKIDAIGDAVIWYNILGIYKEHFKDYKIDLICSEGTFEFYSKLDVFYSIYTIDFKKIKGINLESLKYRFLKFRAIRKNAYELAIQNRFSRNLLIEDSLIRIINASLKIGTNGETDLKYKWLKARYNRLIEIPRITHELERNYAFLNELLNTNYDPQLPKFNFNYDLPQTFLLPFSYYVIFPGAKDGIRNWPIENFISIIEKIKESSPIVPVICGSVQEKVLGDQVKFKFPEAIDLTGATSIFDLISVIQRAQFIITNETSAVHIATATSTPFVCILGGGHFNRFAPYPDFISNEKMKFIYHKMDCFSCNWVCKYTGSLNFPSPCILNVGVDSVMNEIKNFL